MAMKRQRDPCVVLCLVAGLTAAASAQSRRPAPARPATRGAPPERSVDTTPKYSTEDFDEATRRLPPSYMGHSIEWNYDRFVGASKTEFETQAQYIARLPRANDDEILAFRIEPNPDSGPNIRYDAEKGAFDIRVWEDFGIFEGTGATASKTYARRAVMVHSTGSTSLYTASNAFGAKATVDRETRLSYAVMVDGRTPGPGEERLHHLWLEMAAADAATMRDRLGMLLICHASGSAGPLTHRGDEFKGATLSSPHETLHEHRYLKIQSIKAAWVYDLPTGTVLKKFPSF